MTLSTSTSPAAVPAALPAGMAGTRSFGTRAVVAFKGRWPLVKGVFTVAMVVCVLGVLAWKAREVDWHGVWVALAAYSHATIALAAVLVVCSFAAYSAFDLLARGYTRGRMSVAQVMGVTFTSHALGLNLGIVGVALRFRLYGAYGLEAASVAGIFALSVMTNWLGFFALGGLIFAGHFVELPLSADFRGFFHPAAMFGVGIGLLVAVALYLLGCLFGRGRSFEVLGRRLTVPSLSFAVRQLLLSILNWTLISSVIYVLLRGQIDFATVLGVYMLSAIALAVIDIPGGLGITEGVFLAMLGTRMPVTELLAALVVFRAIFYLAPTLPAVLCYLYIESRNRGPRPP